MIVKVSQVILFILAMTRMFGIFISAPIFSMKLIPTPFKIGISFWTTLLIFFFLPVPKSIPTNTLSLVTALSLELFLGILIGFTTNLIFVALQSAGSIIDLQMGLSVANVLAPETGGSATLISRMSFYLGLVIFITIGGHHLFLSGFNQSFQLIPIGSNLIFQTNFINFFVRITSQIWYIALTIAAPAVLLIFLSDFSFGIVSRVAPQVNVFMLGFQVKPSLGLFAIFISLPIIAKRIVHLIISMGEEIIRLLSIIKVP